MTYIYIYIMKNIHMYMYMCVLCIHTTIMYAQYMQNRTM